MGEEILDVIDPLLVYTILGGFILFYGLVSLIVKEKLFLSEAFVATFMGLIVGPACLNWVNPMHWENKDQVTEELTRIVLAIQVMAAGINLPRAYITRQFTSMAIMLLPVMVWMWITSAVIIYHFIPELTFLESLLIASCITPTDPILANSVVQGSFAEKHIPSNVRHLLSAESGANDGMGFPFMFLALYLLQKSNTTGSAISQWIYFVWGYHILFSIVIGIIIGWGAKKLLEIARSKNWIDKESFLVFAIALAIFVVGGVSILGSDALLSCFTAGSILAWDDWFRQETRDAHLQEVIDLLLTLTTFTYIGMIVPWSRFNSDILSLQRLIPISILILIFRRLPIVLTLKKFIPAIHTFKEAMFAGYFGPIGVGAVFLAMTVKHEVEKRENDMDANIANRTKDNVFPIVAFIVISSVVVHGITVPILNIGSRIDIERLPTIASISDQVARLPIVDFVESLSVEHDAQGSVRKKEKTKDEIVNSDEGDDSDHDDNGEYEEEEEQHEEHHQNPHHGIRIEEEEEGIDESDNNSVKDEINTNILIDLGNGDDEEVDNQSQSSKNKLPSRNSSESVDNISSDYNQNNQK